MVVLEYGARAPGHAFEQDAGVLEMNMESLSVSASFAAVGFGCWMHSAIKTHAAGT